MGRTNARLRRLNIRNIIRANYMALMIEAYAFRNALLIVMIRECVVDAIETAATRNCIIVLTSANLRRLVRPVYVNDVLRIVLTVLTRLMAAEREDVKIEADLARVIAVLINIRRIVCVTEGLIGARMAEMIRLRELIFLAVLNDSSGSAVDYAEAVSNAHEDVLRSLSNLGVVEERVASDNAR